MADDSSEDGRSSRSGAEPGERSVISRKELYRVRMREARRRAYAEAKAKRQQDPRYLALKEAAKLRRREEYRRAKALRAEAEQAKPRRAELGEAKASRASSPRALSPRAAQMRAQREAAATERSSEAVSMRRAELRRGESRPAASDARVSKQQQLAELRAKLERALAPSADEVANDVGSESV